MSGRIPQHFIDDLIARADIVDVLGRRIQLRKAGREYKALCPFHDEKTPSFTVSPQKGFYHCFGCGAHGTALGFLMDYEHLAFPDAVETLAQQMGLEVPREGGEKPARRFDELYELMARAGRDYQSQLREQPAAVEYLKARGIDGGTARRFGLGYAPAGWSHLLDRYGKSAEDIERLLACGLVIRRDSGQHYDRFRERLMFPIRDARGRTIGFGGRVIGDGEPKYLNSPETPLFHKGRELYGLYEARQALRSIERLVVVEGYMDVVGLARHGIDFACATLGTATTEEHLNRLFRLTDEVYFAFDADRAGRQAAWRALETALPHLREGRQVRFVFLPEGEDPDSFVAAEGTTAFEAKLDAGQPLSEFLVEELASQVELHSVDGRARLAELAKPLVTKLPEGVYRELLTARLAETIGLSAAKLEALFGRDGPAGAGPAGREPARARAPRRTGGAPNRPSVVRRAITLILHTPQAALELDATLLAGVERPGARLLHDLIETVHEDPDITTAGLLERWRHDPEGRHLGKLAATELPGGDDFDPRPELAECLARLRRGAERNRIEYLIEKERLGALSEDQKQELRTYRRESAAGG